MRRNRTSLLLLCGMLSACAQQPGKQDPLQNTKKLAAEGHATLYHNGAFEIPMTTIHIIPPGPDAWDLAAEMAGLRARQSFQESKKHALESIDLARAGVNKSAEIAGDIKKSTDETAKSAREVTRFGVGMAGASPGLARDIVGASVTFSLEAGGDVSKSGDAMAQGALAAGGAMSQGTDDAAKTLGGGTLALAGATSVGSYAAAGKHASSALRFVKGYAALPEKLGQRAATAGNGAKASVAKFVEAYRNSDEWRAQQSARMADIVVETKNNYTKDVAASFRAASRELEGTHDTGYTLAMLKSLGWLVQGVFWEATIKPAGKVAGASLGYVAANGVAFPALVITRGGVAVADVAVQVTWNTAAGVYDVTAPTGAAVLAGMFSAVELVGGQIVAAGELVGGSLVTAGTYVGGKTLAGATAGGGYLAGKTVQYVGAPLSTVGIAAGGTAIGVVMGAGAAVTGAGVVVGGVASEAATQVGGNVAAGTTLVGGTVASVATGTALGMYELSKAVVVPTGYVLGSGVVVGYETMSQLAAHTILAVGDASYMVLSLEGANWVLYAVKGKVDNGENLPPGAIVDLKAMQKAGEEFVAVPVSPEEMKRVVEAVPGDLPVNPPVEAKPQAEAKPQPEAKPQAEASQP